MNNATKPQTSSLQILMQVDPPTSRPFRMLEVYQSMDGLRTRVCAGAWKSLREATLHKEKLLGGKPDIQS